MDDNKIVEAIVVVKENKGASLAIFMFLVGCFLPCVLLVFLVERNLFIELDIWKLLLLILSITSVSLLACAPLGIVMTTNPDKGIELRNPKVAFVTIIMTEYVCAFTQLICVIGLMIWSDEFLDFRLCVGLVYTVCIICVFYDYIRRKKKLH